MRNTLTLTALAGLVFASCQSANGPTFRSGTVRTGVSGSWSSMEADPGVDTDTLALDLQVGSLVTPTVEIGADIQYSDVDAGAAAVTSWGLHGYGRYYFQETGPLRGWGQARVGWVDSDIGPVSDSAIAWQVALGASQFITDSTALEAALSYGMTTLALGAGGSDVDFTTTALTIGYALYY